MMASISSAAAVAPVVARPGVARRANAGRAPAAVARAARVASRASLRSVGGSQVRVEPRLERAVSDPSGPKTLNRSRHACAFSLMPTRDLDAAARPLGSIRH